MKIKFTFSTSDLIQWSLITFALGLMTGAIVHNCPPVVLSP